MSYPANSPSRSGRLYLILLGGILALAGAVFAGLMWRSFQRAREMRAWPEVPCVILSSEVEERRVDVNSNSEFRFNVSFGYEWGGRAYTSDRFTWRGSPWSSRRDAAEEKVAAYPAGGTTTCRVDPSRPEFALLKPDTLAVGYTLWFPALFVAGGLGICWRAIRGSAKN